MFKEEAYQFARGVRACRVSERTIATTARPRMSGAVYGPPLHHSMAVGILVNRPRVRAPAGRPILEDRRPRAFCAGGPVVRHNRPLPDELFCVAWMDRVILISVEQNQRDGRAERLRGIGGSLLHGLKR